MDFAPTPSPATSEETVPIVVSAPAPSDEQPKEQKPSYVKWIIIAVVIALVALLILVWFLRNRTTASNEVVIGGRRSTSGGKCSRSS